MFTENCSHKANMLRFCFTAVLAFLLVGISNAYAQELSPEGDLVRQGLSSREKDHSKYLEELKTKLASETKPREIERLKREIVRVEELQEEEQTSPEELLAEAEAIQCSPKDGMCLAKKSSKISKAKAKIVAAESKKKVDAIHKAMDKRHEEEQKQAEAERIKAEAEQKALEAEQAEKDRQELERQEKELQAYAKAKSDYATQRTKELSADRSLLTFKPGTKLCNFPEGGRAYIFVEDVDKNKVHILKEYGVHPMLQFVHKGVLRKHPKFDGKYELELLEYGGPPGMMEIGKLKEMRAAYSKCGQ